MLTSQTLTSWAKQSLCPAVTWTIRRRPHLSDEKIKIQSRSRFPHQPQITTAAAPGWTERFVHPLISSSSHLIQTWYQIWSGTFPKSALPMQQLNQLFKKRKRIRSSNPWQIFSTSFSRKMGQIWIRSSAIWTNERIYREHTAQKLLSGNWPLACFLNTKMQNAALIQKPQGQGETVG